jgi:hypothetical protein
MPVIQDMIETENTQDWCLTEGCRWLQTEGLTNREATLCLNQKIK